MSELSLPMYTTEKNSVQFSEHAVQNEVVSNKAGRAMFDKILRIHISVPGQKDVQTYEVDRYYPEGYPHPNPEIGKVRKNETIYKRFGRYIEEYKKNASTQALAGTPIEKWPMVDVRQVAMLKSLGVHTVEALSEITDASIQNIGMGGRELVRKAKDWLQTAHNSAATTELQAQLRVRDDAIARLQEQMTALTDAMASLSDEEQSKVKAELGKRNQKAKAA